MSTGVPCTCLRSLTRMWVVVDRLCNYSAFNGYHYTPSRYSCVRCMRCGGIWRTNAKYVATLPDATPDERTRTVYIYG